MNNKKILVVDDEPAVRFGLREYLGAHGFEVIEAQSCSEARERFARIQPDVALIDYRLDDGNAVELMAELRELDSGVPMLVLTGHGSIDLAVEAIKQGAEHFLTKPIELPALLVVLRRVLETRRLHRRQRANSVREQRDEIDPFLGESEAIRTLAEQAGRVRDAELPLLIQGETGTGKSLLAAWLHRHGPRADEAFVDINCAGLVADLLETELFGHQKGAFTGANAAKTGLLEVADRGTVFLDEIGDVDATIQPKLLKVLEERRFRRLGEVRDRQVDIRLIAATHQDLRSLVDQGRFRSDLYFRISTIPLRMPALRERREDIPILAAALLRRIAADTGRPDLSLSPAALGAMQRYRWPGNIRELRNVLERAVLFSDGRRLEVGSMQFDSPGQQARSADDRDGGSNEAGNEGCDDGRDADDLTLTLEAVQRRHIERVMRDEGGRVEAAARRLGMPRSSLYQKLKLYGAGPSRRPQ